MGLIKSTAMKKIYIYISLVVAASVGYCAGYFLGSHDVILTEDGGDWEDFYLYESEPLTYSTNK